MKLSHQFISADVLNTSIQHIQNQDELPKLFRDLGFEFPRPALVVVGGASKLSEADFKRVQKLFTEVLAPLAQELGLFVVDGGTDAGVMRLIGHARSAIDGTFPLIGVAPIGLVTFPEQHSPNPDASPLEPNHTHCLLIPGDKWGDESPWIADVATVLSKGLPSVAVLINGGEVTWKDASCNVDEKRPIVVIAGSGRTADIMADALKGKVTDKRAHRLLASDLLQSVELNEKTQVLTATLKNLLTA
ncbi:MAG: hypothetical protein QNJ46_25360 [Leptolyngbyaceae cyanobacterium MO_188.B28]|nr:hypothetical protein [Leptolyngbyaceae cyanobacterium MO_188.B28]